MGFAAETQNLIENAKAKLINKNLDLIVANDVSNNKVFNQDTNQVIVIKKDFTQFSLSKTSKDNVAKFILQHIINEYNYRNSILD